MRGFIWQMSNEFDVECSDCGEYPVSCECEYYDLTEEANEVETTYWEAVLAYGREHFPENTELHDMIEAIRKNK